jgi:hypothetical protein
MLSVGCAPQAAEIGAQSGPYGVPSPIYSTAQVIKFDDLAIMHLPLN